MGLGSVSRIFGSGTFGPVGPLILGHLLPAALRLDRARILLLLPVAPAGLLVSPQDPEAPGLDLEAADREEGAVEHDIKLIAAIMIKLEVEESLLEV